MKYFHLDTGETGFEIITKSKIWRIGLICRYSKFINKIITTLETHQWNFGRLAIGFKYKELKEQIYD